MGNQKNQDDLPPNVKRSIQAICKDEGYVIYDLKSKLIPAEGGNFLGKLYAITVTGSTNDGEKETNIFAKCIIPCEKLESTFNLPGAYAAEAYVYNELSRIFTEIQEDAQIPTKDRFKIVKSFKQSNSEALILENVAIKGYKSRDRYYMMDMNVAKLTLVQLAKFHALTFVLEKKKPDYFQKIKAVRIPWIINEDWDKSARHIAHIAAKYTRQDTKERLEKFIERFTATLKRYLQTDLTKCCLCHGDFRLGNMLMKETNGKVSDVIPVDYQLIHYGCPINDLLFFIYLGTDREFRQKNLHYLKNFYFDTLKDFLSKFDVDVEESYPKKEFDRDFKERLDYGLLCSLYFMPFFLAAEGETPDLGEESITEMDFKVHETFPERMQGIVDDFVEMGYL